MSETTYQFYKNKFDTTKPIRGRTEEIRPIGQRRRDWEQVTRKDLGNGQFAYCAKLYGTDVVEYHPDGSVVVRVGGWATPTTAEFIHVHSPFSCFKQNRKLWVRCLVGGVGGDQVKLYPLTNESMRFKWLGGHDYEPVEPIFIKKQVVNRSKAKSAREPVMPFVEWARVFVSMSDGWLMHETRKQVFGWNENRFAKVYRLNEKESYEKLLGASQSSEPEAVYMEVLCSWSNDFKNDERLAETHVSAMDWNGRPYTHSTNYYDYQVDFTKLKRRVYKWVEKYSGAVYDTVEVEPTDRTMTNVI